MHAVQQATQRGAGDGDRSRQVHLQRVRGAVRGDPRGGPRRGLTRAGASADSAKRAAPRAREGRRAPDAGPVGVEGPVLGSVSGPAKWRFLARISGTTAVPLFGPPTKMPACFQGKRPRAILEVRRSLPSSLARAPQGDALPFGALVSWELASITADSGSSSAHIEPAPRVAAAFHVAGGRAGVARRAQSGSCVCRSKP